MRESLGCPCEVCIPPARVAVSGIPKGRDDFKQFMRRVRKAVGGNDKTASHATRVAGTENFKPDYYPDFPVVTTVHGMPGRIMTAETLAKLGLLADPEPTQEWTPRVQSIASHRGRIWPSYAQCLAGAPIGASGKGPDRSKADFTFCKFAAQRGFTVDEIAAELPNVSERARERIQNRDPGYVTVTAQNGAAAAARGRQRSRA